MTKGQGAGRDKVIGLAALVPLVLLALSLPFELDVPLWQAGPLAITNVEVLLFLTLAAAAVSFFHARQIGHLNRYHWWLPVFAGVMLLSTAAAPQLQVNALKASLRLISGMLLALAVTQLVRRPQDSRLVGYALLIGGLIAAFTGMWEINQSRLAWADLFRSHITRVGSYWRLTGTLDYANQIAMYIEATLPFLVAAAWFVGRSGSPRRVKYSLLSALLVLTLFYVQASVLTLSRASFATIILVCLLMAVWLAVGQPAESRKMALWWVGLASLTAVLTAGNVLFNDSIRLRLQGGNVDEWYQASIMAPPTLVMAGGDTLQMPITVTNEGALIWRSQGANPIQLGARWIPEEGEAAQAELRWPFPDPVRPQETVQMNVHLTAPRDAGRYELRWDVVEEHVTWFGTKSGRFATSQVTVVAGAGQTEPAEPAETGGDDRAAWAYAGAVPNRTTLWLAGLQMIRERPIFGIGMDNFRLTYGERLDLPYFDNTVHVNNFYLEMVISVGVIGALVFFLWLGGLLIDMARTLRRPDKSMWQAAIAAGLLAFLIHGFLDFFLMFNATGLLFWILVGLWCSEKNWYAHRI